MATRDGKGPEDTAVRFDCAIVGPQPSGWRDQVTAFIGRREFITLLGGTAATWPLGARAQQSVIPVIGFLSGRSQDEASGDTAAFHQGLNEMGYVGGRNVVLEYRWAEGRNELLSDLAAELVRRQVARARRRRRQ